MCFGGSLFGGRNDASPGGQRQGRKELASRNGSHLQSTQSLGLSLLDCFWQLMFVTTVYNVATQAFFFLTIIEPFIKEMLSYCYRMYDNRK